MENQEQELARVSLELDDLRAGVGQIMEMLQVIKAKMDPSQVIVISEISGPTFVPQPARIMPSTWSPCGLPPNCSPSFKETLCVM